MQLAWGLIPQALPPSEACRRSKLQCFITVNICHAIPAILVNMLCKCCRYATAAGVGIASLGLALSANAASVKLGATGGALVFDPAEVTIKSGETVTWTNNIGFPHNVVFDEDGIPVIISSLLHLHVYPWVRLPQPPVHDCC